MKRFLVRKLIILTLMLMLAIPINAYADFTTYKCGDGVGCIDERINFGTAQIKCTDVNGDVLSDWICEYEAEYSCKNTMTGEVRSGGFDPLTKALCNKLCGPCQNGWK